MGKHVNITTSMKTDVLIIGGGLAGLAAAHTLRELGTGSIVLEARNRIGGRIHTALSLSSCPVDLGASWFHGVQENPLMKLLSGDSSPENHTELFQTSPDNYWLSTNPKSERLFDSTEELDEDELSSFLEKYEEFLNNVRTAARVETDELVSVNSTILQMMDKGDLFTTERERKLWRWYLFKREVWMASHLEDLTLKEWADDAEWGHMEGAHCLVKSGHSSIVEKLAKNIDVRTDHEVSSIDFSSPSGNIIVKTKNDATFEAKKVLVTLPLGVLKSSETIFKGELSAEKREAIRKLKMGSYGKVALEFDEAFWSPHLHPEKHFIGSISNDSRNDFCLFLDYSNAKGAPILVGFTIDAFTRKMERLSDQEIIDKMMSDLVKIFPDAINKKPSRYLITRWDSDRYSCGAYSYLPVGCSEVHVENLSKPEANWRLFFAGEATHLPYQGSTVGAFVSGVREAELIHKELHRCGQNQVAKAI